MLQQQSVGYALPTANVAINKSRLKIYNNKSSLPTYYLQKGQEFQIELFNPTSGTVLAKIELNGKYISQGGLVLRPGERVHLDRYIDVPSKFLFDTYEVNNTEEVRKAIEENGDLKVEFYREYVAPVHPTWTIQPYYNDYYSNNPFIGVCNTGSASYSSGTVTTSNANNANLTAGSSSFTSSVNIGAASSSTKSATMDWLNQDLELSNKKSKLRGIVGGRLKKSVSKSIETGRVEQGSHSDQTFKTVSKTFDTWAFHTVSYKLLPVSTKINTVSDINVRKYCVNCGTKLGKTDKFCSTCGTKA